MDWRPVPPNISAAGADVYSKMLSDCCFSSANLMKTKKKNKKKMMIPMNSESLFPLLHQQSALDLIMACKTFLVVANQ